MEPDGRRLVFVAGLHRSGTTALSRALAAHPQISGLSGTGVAEDEGQHLQPVYPPARAYGGPGRFAFDDRAHLTSTSPLVGPGNAQRIWDAWTPHWDLARPYLLEKSPPNLIMGRFLQALFPGSALVVLVRHPVIVTLSTRKWAPRVSPHRLMEHWTRAHDLFRADRPALRRVVVLHYEDLVHDPDPELARVSALLGLDGTVPAGAIQSTRSSTYADQWTAMGRGRGWDRARRERIERDFSAAAARWGYDLADPLARPRPGRSAD